MIELLTAQEVAKLLKVNYRKVLDLIAAGELKAHKVGRVFRVRQKDLDTYLRSAKVQTIWDHMK